MGFTERSDFYGVQGGSMKNQYIAQKGRLWHFVDLRGGLARKRGAVILRGGLISQCTLWSNWIIQILHYYCMKQHKNIKNSDYWTKCCYLSLCPSLCLLWLALTSPSSAAEIFSSWTQYSTNFKCHKWSLCHI